MEDLTENIRNALRYIEANLHEDLPLCNIARHAYLSPFYFQRVFSALCGTTLDRDSNAAINIREAGLSLLTA